MKKLVKIFCSLPLLFFTYGATAQTITGAWQGELDIQGKHIPVVFHIAKDGDKLSASFDSPSQNVFNLKCSDVIQKKDSVTILLAAVNIKYSGQLSTEKQLKGSWFQGPGSLPLILNKTSESAAVITEKRPQTPVKPYPYQSEDIEFTNADRSIRFAGTLTYPTTNSLPAIKTASQYPAVMMITGSGQQDRDETLFGHKSFAVIADYLTKMGFAVLRVDDRGIGKTTGNYQQASSLDFAKDIEAGLDFLKNNVHINQQKIGLLGHSEGGMIAQIVASERKDIKFIVMLAAPGIPTIDLMQQQTEAWGIAEGMPVQDAKLKGLLVSAVWTEGKKNNDRTTALKNIKVKIDSMFKTADPATVSRLRSTDTTAVEGQLNAELNALNGPWLKYFINYDPQLYLQKLDCKILAINGSKDVQVNAAANLKRIKSALGKSKSRQYDIVELPGLNHLFQTCVKCTPSEYHELEESFSPLALQTIGNWLVKNVK
jgi:pimeloyl-ACP methyl ester carboxylesterase